MVNKTVLLLKEYIADFFYILFSALRHKNCVTLPFVTSPRDSFCLTTFVHVFIMTPSRSPASSRGRSLAIICIAGKTTQSKGHCKRKTMQQETATSLFISLLLKIVLNIKAKLRPVNIFIVSKYR